MAEDLYQRPQIVLMYRSFYAWPSQWAMRIILLAIFIGVEIVGEDIIRLRVNRQRVEHGIKRTLVSLLLVNVEIDGQPVVALVDTGSAALLFVWKPWYEHQMGVGSCEQLFSKCYQCPQSCAPKDTSEITFGGGSVKATIFSHSGAMLLSSKVVKDLRFDLICGYEPSPTVYTPRTIFGLGLSSDPKYASIMNQLTKLEPKVVRENTFSLYLKPKTPSTGIYEGELLLGGGDPKLYEGELSYVPVEAQVPWTVKLKGVEIVTGQITPYNEKIFLDTGTNFMVFPISQINKLIDDIAKQASDNAKEKVEIIYHESVKRWTYDCTYREYLPTLRFLLQSSTGEGVPIEISYHTYAPEEGNCCLYIRGVSEPGLWILPDFMLVGNYLEFQGDEKRIGIAKLK